MLAVAPALLFTALQVADVGVPRELGRAAEGGRGRERRRGSRHRRARGEGLRPGTARARAARRAFRAACSRRACGSSIFTARLQPTMQTIPRFGQVAVLARRRMARDRRQHQPRHVPRVLDLHAADHAAGAAARRDPHRRAARARRCGAHLRPARLDAARAGRARRARART